MATRPVATEAAAAAVDIRPVVTEAVAAAVATEEDRSAPAAVADSRPSAAADSEVCFE